EGLQLRDKRRGEPVLGRLGVRRGLDRGQRFLRSQPHRRCVAAREQGSADRLLVLPATNRWVKHRQDQLLAKWDADSHRGADPYWAVAGAVGVALNLRDPRLILQMQAPAQPPADLLPVQRQATLAYRALRLWAVPLLHSMFN